MSRSTRKITGRLAIVAVAAAMTLAGLSGCSSVSVLKKITLNTPASDIAISRDGSTFYYYDYHMSDIVAVDTQTGKPKVAAHAPALSGLVLSHDGKRVFGVPDQGVMFAVVDSTTLDRTPPVIVSSSVPWAMSVAPDDSRVYVANKTGPLTVVDVRSGRTTTVPGATAPTDVESSTNHVYLADAATRAIRVLSTSGEYQSDIGLPGHDAPDASGASSSTSLATAITPDGRELLVVDTARGELSFIDLASSSVVSTVTVNDGGASAIEMGATGRIAYIANAKDRTITEIDVQNHAVTKTIDLGFTPGPAAEVPGGHFLLVPCGSEATVSVVVV